MPKSAFLFCSKLNFRAGFGPEWSIFLSYVTTPDNITSCFESFNACSARGVETGLESGVISTPSGEPKLIKASWLFGERASVKLDYLSRT